MATYEYSRWDGTQQFTPQSADALYDQISRYLLEYGEQALEIFEQLERENPEVLEMLMRRGHVEKDKEGRFQITPQGMRRVENKALEELFQTLGRDKMGRHETPWRGVGQTMHDESKPYEYGDPIASLNLHETLKNALHRQGGGSPVRITEDDLVVHDTEYQTSCATVLLVDMSGSMARGGKFGQAKRVALALQALVRSKYPGDSLQTVGFYSYASPLTERELFYAAPKPVSIYDSRVHLRINLEKSTGFVPEHFTNIHAGLQFARRMLRRQPAVNKQIITITDGEPTAHLEGNDLPRKRPRSR
jgi:Ca-activated chloride channel homolog